MSDPTILDRHAIATSDEAAELPLGLVLYDGTHHDRPLLTRGARRLREAGWRIGGILESERQRPGRAACDMFLENLETGEAVCITADRGRAARGCRLDYAALARATHWAEQALAAGPQLLILNKLGKEETLGRGFFPVIAEALSRDIPVLAGVSALNFEAAQAITAGAGRVVPANDGAILAWCEAALRRRAG